MSKFQYSKWRHGGWYVENVIYPSGAVGCVSRNHPDKRWRIVCDERLHDFSYDTRDDAARAELQIVKEMKARLAARDTSVKSVPNDPVNQQELI